MAGDVFTQGPVDDILDNLAVLLAVAGKDALQDNPRRSVTDNAARDLRKVLGIGMSTTADEIKAALITALQAAARAGGAGHEG